MASRLLLCAFVVQVVKYTLSCYSPYQLSYVDVPSGMITVFIQIDAECPNRHSLPPS